MAHAAGAADVERATGCRRVHGNPNVILKDQCHAVHGRSLHRVRLELDPRWAEGVQGRAGGGKERVGGDWIVRRETLAIGTIRALGERIA